MKNSFLALISIGFISVITFILFFFNTQPIKLPTFDPSTQEKIDEPMITFVNPSKGPADAKVTIVEYGDFQCDTCAQMSVSIDAVQQAFPNDVRIVWKNYPNESLHPESTPAAIAAHCAERQGAFWQYHDALFALETNLNASVYPAIAKELELDTQRFADCLKTQDTLGIIQKDFEEARALNLSATPVIFIGKEVFVGYLEPEELTSLVTAHLK